MEAMLESAELADVILVGARGLQVQVSDRANERQTFLSCVTSAFIICTTRVFTMAHSFVV